MYIDGYKLLVRYTCIRLHVYGVNAALDKLQMTGHCESVSVNMLVQVDG